MKKKVFYFGFKTPNFDLTRIVYGNDKKSVENERKERIHYWNMVTSIHSILMEKDPTEKTKMPIGRYKKYKLKETK